MFKLPELTWELDCEPLGYAGLVVVMVLNPPIEDEELQRISKETNDGQPWSGPFYRQMARIVKGVTIPGKWSKSGEDLELELGSAEALWQLEHDQGFDPQVLQWALRQYAQKRQERLQAESKN